MAGKAKFDQEAAFKSIIGAGHQRGDVAVAEEKNTKKIVTEFSVLIIWIGILIRRCVGCL